MFSLGTVSFPPTAEALSEALKLSLAGLVRSPAGPRVEVEERAYPDLTAIRIHLDGAEAGERMPPPPAVPAGEVQAALQSDHLVISAHPLRIQNAPIEFHCEAQKVKIARARDQTGNLLLLLEDAASGKLDLSIAVADLERLVKTTITELARKQGVVLEDLRLQLKARGPRALDAQLLVRARKLFLNTQVRLSGSLEIDDQFTARFSGLDCSGEGTLGTLACGFLIPKLQELNKREFSLLTLPVGEVKLRDVRIAVGDKLRASAEFGRPA
jgi:hypothetical protein